MKTFIVKIEVRPADGVLDPQGKTVLSTLKKLGFDGVFSAAVGKLIELKVVSPDKDSAGEDARKMCSEFLANPVIEAFSIEVKEDGG